MEKELSGFKKTIGSTIYGLIYGALSPMPGISAGTLGIFFNVFDDFFMSATAANARKNWHFILIFCISWGLGLFGISRVIVFLLDNYEQVVYLSFIGLILGCVPMIFKKAKAERIGLKNFIIFIFSFALMLLIVVKSGDINAQRTLEQYGGISPALLAWLFFASFAGGAAMVIPGVGGSLVMLALGIYEVYIEAVSTLNPLLLTVLGTSMILGFLTGVKIVKKLLETHSNSLYCSILGFILGSVYFIYPGFPAGLWEGVLSVILALFFAFLAFRLSSRG